MNMISIENAFYSYEEAAALKDVTLRINRGESVALIGPNGCGKSTLLKMINGIVLPDKGIYKFNGEEITAARLKDARFSKLFHKKIGFIFQNSEAQLFCSDVYDEIAFGPRQMGLDENDVDARVNDCLNLLNIQKLKRRQPYHLSGGEKRKVAIASVLSLNPEVLVLDEPMNGLDPRTQIWLVEFIIEMEKAGKTIISSTHNLELVQEIAGRVILFDENHTIVADMPTARLLQDSELLKKDNLVDEHYHRHGGKEHAHFHMHKF